MATGTASRNIEHLWVEHVINGAEIPLLKKNTGQGSNFYWDGDTIYSYGRHFPIARVITVPRKGKAVLFTRRSYSVTTSGHIARVRRALQGRDVPLFCVDRPDESPTRYAKEYKEFFERHSNLAFEAAAKARGRAGQLLQQGLDLIEEGNQMSAFFGFRWKLKAPANLDLKELRAQIKARQAKEEAARAERLAGARLWHEMALEAWAESRELTEEELDEKPNLSWQDREHVLKALPVRLRLDTALDSETEKPITYVQTSLNATVPVKDALRLLALWESVKGTGYQHGAHTFHVGAFRLDSISPEGTIKAGCHTILAEEVERFAPILRKAV